MRSCRNCIYFMRTKNYCLLLNQHVDDPEDPPCLSPEGRRRLEVVRSRSVKSYSGSAAFIGFILLFALLAYPVFTMGVIHDQGKWFIYYYNDPRDAYLVFFFIFIVAMGFLMLGIFLNSTALNRVYMELAENIGVLLRRIERLENENKELKKKVQELENSRRHIREI